MTTLERPQTDHMRLLEAIAARGEVSRDELQQLFPGWSKNQLDGLVSRASMLGAVGNGATTALLKLTASGRQAVDREREAREVQTEPATEFATLRAAYEASLPGYRAALAEQARSNREARWRAAQAEERAISAVIPLDELGIGWRWDAEPDPTANNVLALFPPAFPDLPQQSQVYIRVLLNSETHVAWLQASSGGPELGIPEGWPPSMVRDQVLRVLVPASDGTVTPLPGQVTV